MDESEKKARQNLYKKRYRERKKALEQDILKGGKFVFREGISVVKSMIQSANSNPIMGMVAAVVLADVLARSHIIDNKTALGIWVLVGVVEGSSVAGTVISDFTDIFKVFSKSPSQDLLRPSATTIVYGGKDEDLQALMNKE